MVVLFTKFNKCLLITYSIPRQYAHNRNCWCAGWNDEVGEYLSNTALVPDTTVGTLKVRGQKEHQRRKPSQPLECRLTSVHCTLLFLLVFALYRALFHFWTTVPASWMCPYIPLPFPSLSQCAYLVPNLWVHRPSRAPATKSEVELDLNLNPVKSHVPITQSQQTRHSANLACWFPPHSPEDLRRKA